MPSVLLKDVIERAPSSQKSSNIDSNLFAKTSSDVPTGFPKATHRSESAFARARAMRESSRPTNAPRISHTSITPEIHRRIDKEPPADLPVSTKAADTDDWKSTMANENTRKVEEMSENQREKERAELISHFGPGIVDLVQKIAERRKLEEGQPSLSGHERPKSAMAHSRSTTTESSPSNKPLRKLRFSENPDKVYVYESEPSSPKRVLALPPPPTDRDPNEDVPVISLENWQKGSPKKKKQSTRRLDDNDDDGEKPGGESTPETIREKYFPEEPHPSQNPTLAWIMPGTDTSTVKTTPIPSSSASSPPLTVRYDLQGRVIPDHLKQTIPSHLGLHHHGDSPDDAGYTLDELLLLSRSTLPAQRAVMLLVLGRIVRRLRDGRCSEPETLHMKEMFQKCLIVGIEAFGDRASSSVRMAGLDVIWHGTAYLSAPNNSSSTIPISISQDPTQLETLPISYLLEGTLFNFTRSSPNSTLLIRIFESLNALVVASPKVASQIFQVDGLLNNAIKSITLFESETKGEEEEEGHTNTVSIVFVALLRLVNSIAITSRSTAHALIPDVSDAFLKNLITLPFEWNESTGPSLSSSFLVAAHILDFYSTLGRYGLGASIASTGHEIFQNLSFLITGTTNSLHPASAAQKTPLPLDEVHVQRFIDAWLNLHEIWITCAINPHNTTPEHDLLWSHLVAWQWSDNFLELRKRILEVHGLDRTHVGGEKAVESRRNIWASWWRVWTRWMEGCRINQADRGSDERERMIAQLPSSWKEGGLERTILEETMKQLVARPGDVVTDHHYQCARAVHATLLFLLQEEGGMIHSLASSLSEVLGSLMEDGYWERIRRFCASSGERDIRQWTNLVVVVLRCLHRIMDDTNATPTQTTTTEPMVILEHEYKLLHRLVPGDEMLASELITSVLQATLRPEMFMDVDVVVKKGQDIWNAGGGPVKVLMPLYRYALWPREDHFVGPFVAHPTALKMTTTLRTLNTNAYHMVPPPSSLLPPASSYSLPSHSNTQDATKETKAVTGIEIPQRTKGDWIVAPLDVLLRSGSTHKRLFQTLPADWNASETEIVRGVLMLLLKRRVGMCSAQMVFTCMKVFMLEHHHHSHDSGMDSEVVGGFGGGGEEEEVYRDPVVGELMMQLVEPYRLKSRRKAKTNAFVVVDPLGPSLEVVSRSFLGPAQPFFQFYSDFVGLYDSVSFGHGLFSALLLPPTTTTRMDGYARDYRRLLWNDYGHVLRSVGVEVPDVLLPVSMGVEEEEGGGDGEEAMRRGWLERIEGKEGDGEMLNAYVKALIKGHVMGFVRFVAIHQVAGCLWPESMQQDRQETQEDPNTKDSQASSLNANLLKALLSSSVDEDTLQDLLGYSQPASNNSTRGENELGKESRLPPPRSSSLVIPPACYRAASSALQMRRLDWAASVCGGELVRRRFPPVVVA